MCCSSGSKEKICIVVDNTTWHSQLTDASKISLRSLNKDKIRRWLINHTVPFIEQHNKSELPDLSYAHAPEKEFDETTKQFDIEILRLPIRHCILGL